GLGGPPEVQERLLSSAGLDWAYSELFQNYSRDQISGYYPNMVRSAENSGVMVSFAETHDNLRLAATSERYARNRFLVCGLLAADGAFGFANGAEFFATEKIDVHGCGALRFGAKNNLVSLIRRINDCHRYVSSFAPGAKLRLIQEGGGNVIALRRDGADGKKSLVLINLDCDRDATVSFPAAEIPEHGNDLLSGRAVDFQRDGRLYRFPLAPGDGVCVVFEEVDFSGENNPEPPRALRQRAAAMAQRAALGLAGYAACGRATAQDLLASPVDFVEKFAGCRGAVTVRNSDVHAEHRQVLLPSQGGLLVRSEIPFRCVSRDDRRTLAAAGSLPTESFGDFALFSLPENTSAAVRTLRIELSLFFADGKVSHIAGEIWQLPRKNTERFDFACDAERAKKCHFFAAGKNGSYTLCRADWSAPYSKYDALLAVNREMRFPSDRRVLFNSFRAWLVVNDFSQEIGARNLVSFVSGSGRSGQWEFLVPAGQGRRTHIIVTITHSADAPGVRIEFSRPYNIDDTFLGNGIRARLVVRPDVEDRVNHEVTKAYAGAEHAFPAEIRTKSDGFSFHGVDFSVSNGAYYAAPEWHYMGHLSLEARYGQEASSDRFSPGYFQAELSGGDKVVIDARLSGSDPDFTPDPILPDPLIRQVEKSTLDAYIVRRDELSTVIAGYPWFLDWGRDTLIVLRGLVSCGFAEESKRIISAFARFERNGTIPNMIRGNDDANRDTSDAPLYLVIATRDYIAATGDRSFLLENCGGRTLREVLLSIVENYSKGTPNGIIMDKESKLIFSPVHFSWMDTNYPAGTPREGYPIEIQALWYAALKFLGFDELAEKVSASVEKYFFSETRAFASDCLHAKRGVPAKNAVPDDHLRSNQLLALTLGAVQNRKLREKILFSSGELIVPGAIRTLADRDVTYELPIDFNGRRLNDARHPYRGRYEGDEDHCRKVAYHNGTAWCWPFPSYCEALYLECGEAVRERALALLLTARKYFETGVPGQMPEVADGDAPHRAGGCIAQAWSVSEFFRVYEILAEN
ncbi:MAG: amylo-alpha-1,6-glucosidase, partial [Victivallaceae bacterium]|nr:amylo-alpha-1,6-glucosidase [Victivallaceae bacterium]